jgi:hypothetical protein
VSDAAVKELLVLCADRNIEFAVRGLLGRLAGVRLRAIRYDIYVHPERDPGCVNRSPEFLRPFAGSYSHALVLFDHAGSGREREAPEQVEESIEARLDGQGWEGSAAVAIAPELENWVWADSPHVPDVLGWKGPHGTLRQWLEARGFWPSGETKPTRPKEALEAVLRDRHKPRSSSIYLDLAGKVSLDRCTDRAFRKFRTTLLDWFAPA